ncbi:hypothetical protein ABR862_004902 [Pseudomonas aeruginosa]
MVEQADNPPVLAAFRDASWCAKPDTRTAKRGHVLGEDGHAACGLVAVMCDPEPAESIPELLRCQRAGCRGRWPSSHPESF